MKELFEVFASRKFVLFAITIGMADLGWIFALIYKPEHLGTISTFLVTLLGTYGGANVLERHVANKATLAGGATLTPPPSALFAARHKEDSNGPKSNPVPVP